VPKCTGAEVPGYRSIGVDAAGALPQNAATPSISERGRREACLEQQDVERIARAAMKELGAHGAVVTINQDGPAGHWRIDIRGGSGPDHIKIKCGQGSSAQWVRDQIFEKYLSNG
jgi:hypothetical protein